MGITRRDFIKMAGIAGSSIGLSMLAGGGLFTPMQASSRFDIQGTFSTLELRNKIKMPIIGFSLSSPEMAKDVSQAKDAVLTAIQSGYKLIDTANVSLLEREVGDAVVQSLVPREELFISSKVSENAKTEDDVLESFNDSLAKLKTDYLDLYIMTPSIEGDYTNEALERDLNKWVALEKLYKEGRVKAIGVKDFSAYQIEKFIYKCEIKPMINQVEINPFQTHERLVELCRNHKIALQAHSPLGDGKISLLNPKLKKLADRHNKSTSQVMLRWSMQKGFVPLMSSLDVDSIKSSVNIFDFTLSAREVSLVSSLKSSVNNKKA